jgi:hypothetical protein
MALLDTLFRDTNNGIIAALVQLVVDDFSVATTPGGESRIKPVRFPGQHSVHTAASFVGSDWVRDTWAFDFWVKSTAFGVVDVVGVVVGVGGDAWGGDSDVLQVPESKSAFDDASVLSTFSTGRVCVSTFGFEVGCGTEEVVWGVRDGLGITIGDSVVFGVHFNAFVGVDQVSASFVQSVNNLSVS